MKHPTGADTKAAPRPAASARMKKSSMSVLRMPALRVPVLHVIVPGMIHGLSREIVMMIVFVGIDRE